MTTGISAYECTPRQIRKHVIRCLTRGRVPFIKSSPGMGKSSIIRSVAEEFGLWLIDHRMSTTLPEDFNGLPDLAGDYATFKPFAEIFPTAELAIPAGYKGFLLFLDEFNAALDKQTQAGAYKLILDKMVGQKKLHPNCVIVCAGNLLTDRAIVSELSTAMKSRVIHLKMAVSFDEWLEDVALPNQYDPRIVAYLSYKKTALMDFRPDSDEDTFRCPRTWEFMNDLIKGHAYGMREEIDSKGQPVKVWEIDEDAALFAGTIGNGGAFDFIQFLKTEEALPRIKEILANPQAAPLPREQPIRWMTVMLLLDEITEKTIEPFTEYVERMGAEFRMLFNRSIYAQKPTLRKHPAFAKAIVELSKHIHDNLAAA